MVLNIKNWIYFHEVHADQFSRFGDDLAGKMRLAISQPTGDRSPYTGRVTRIEDKGSALFHFAVLAPAVDFARVEEVLLLTGQSPQDVAGLFTPDG